MQVSSNQWAIQSLNSGERPRLEEVPGLITWKVIKTTNENEIIQGRMNKVKKKKKKRIKEEYRIG